MKYTVICVAICVFFLGYNIAADFSDVEILCITVVSVLYRGRFVAVDEEDHGEQIRAGELFHHTYLLRIVNMFNFFGGGG